MAEILVEEISSGTTLIDTLLAQAKGRSAKPKKEEDDNLDEEDVAPKKGAKGKADDEDGDDEDDVAEPVEGDDDWDPDFEEFDLPKSRKGKGKDDEEDEDFKVEEEEDFSDMELYNDSASGGFDDDDDY